MISQNVSILISQVLSIVNRIFFWGRGVLEEILARDQPEKDSTNFYSIRMFKRY